MVNYINWSVEDFKKLPRGGHADKIESIVIIPSDEKEMHDSGFRYMEFAIVENGLPRFLIGVNDYLHLLDGRWWGIDCLPCGLLRIYSDKIDLKITFQAYGN